MFTRRQFLQTSGAMLLSSSLPGLSLARTARDERLIVIILRGAMDGLAAVVPYGDSHYRSVRGALALDTPGGEGAPRKLDGMFALHPALASCHEMFAAGELAVVHAVATPYRERSHFDGQAVLENGAESALGESSGWLNRTAAVLAPNETEESLAISLGQNLPLILRGDAQVGSWAPSRLPDANEETLQRIADLYADDPLLSMRLAQALNTDAKAASAMSDSSMSRQSMRGTGYFFSLAEAAGKLLAGPDGPRIAVLEAGGWDTHANQGTQTGLLANRLAMLDKGLTSIRHELGKSWSKTVVLVATEFGRTAAVNGTRGTDHGTASCALLAGGAVRGGQVMADWPGLGPRDLYQERDLRPTADLRSLQAGLLLEHMGVSDRDLNTRVFPGRRGGLMQGLVRDRQSA